MEDEVSAGMKNQTLKCATQGTMPPAPPPVTQPISTPSHTAIRFFADFRHSPTLQGRVLSYLNQTGLLCLPIKSNQKQK